MPLEIRPDTTVPLDPPFNDAEIEALRRFYAIEIKARLAGCGRRELAEDIRYSQSILRNPTPGAMPDSFKRLNVRPGAADRATFARLHALAQIRLDLLSAEEAAIAERVNSLQATRDNLRAHLIEQGPFRHGEI